MSKHSAISSVTVRGGRATEREKLRQTLEAAGYHVSVSDPEPESGADGDHPLSVDSGTEATLSDVPLFAGFTAPGDLEARVNQWLQAASPDPVCIFLLNIDHFKRVRTFLGDEIAALLMAEVAARLRRLALREAIDDDKAHLLAGHLGMDEFVIVVRGIADQVGPSRLARAFLKAVSLPYEGLAPQVYLTARIGITFGPEDGALYRELIRNAESIVHHEAREGRNTYRFYAEGMTAIATRRFEFEGLLSHAVSEGELEVYYQPQANLSDGRVMGAEALVRWRHEGVILPAELFIATAEDVGLISEIGNRVLMAACAEAKRLQDMGLGVFEISINISAYQFRRLDMVNVVRRALESSALPPECLVLEVTESLVLSDVERTVETFTELRSMGVHLALDDFGTGYSSLSYLKSLTIDRLKIDRSFVKGLPDDPGDRAVTEAIVRMAHGLKLEVTAEGIETNAQRDYLARLGCDHYQGYLLAKPLSAAEFETFLTARRTDLQARI